MLVKRTKIEADMPAKLFLKAKKTMGMINTGRIYQLNMLWCLSKAHLKKPSFVINKTINIAVATIKNAPVIKSALFLMAGPPLWLYVFIIGFFSNSFNKND